MILHLVTDRRRLAPGLPEAAAAACILEQARYAVAAGIDAVQLREGDLEARALAALAAALVTVARGSNTRVLLNERLDIALAVGADGVHLRGDSYDVRHVRAIAPASFIVGRSVHAVDDVRAAGAVDYVIAGTVWATPSKPPEHPLLGIDGLAAIVQASHAPVLGIGGVTLNRLRQLADAGAAGAAAIDLFLGAPGGRDGGCRANPLHDVAVHARRG